MSDCLFCAIARREVAADVVHDGDDTIAIRDINPQAPTHILVIPRRHVASVHELREEDAATWMRLLQVAQDLAESEGIGGGYRLVANVGRGGGQTVDHLHLHLLGGRQMTWPPG